VPNTGIASGGLTCKNGALCYHSSSVLVDTAGAGFYESRPNANPENAIAQCKKPTAQIAHLVFADT